MQVHYTKWTVPIQYSTEVPLYFLYRALKTKDRRTYYLLQSYDVLVIGDTSTLIKKSDSKKPGDIIHVVAFEDLYDVLHDLHVNKTGHGGRGKMIEALRTSRYYVMRPPVEIFVACCRVCNQKKSSVKKLVVRPIMSSAFGERGQIDLIDFQSLFKWVLNYQEHTTKFVVLRPLKRKLALHVAEELLKIFLLIGAPKILQSDNGREFVNEIIEELVRLWPECVILHGRHRHPQSQGSIERSNQDIELMLQEWMSDNNSKRWTVGQAYHLYNGKKTVLTTEPSGDVRTRHYSALHRSWDWRQRSFHCP